MSTLADSLMPALSHSRSSSTFARPQPRRRALCSRPVLSTGLLLCVAILVLALTLLPSCGGKSTSEPADTSVTITIGNISDLTGASSNAMRYVNMALEDTVNYYNEQGLIPSAQIRVLTYDGHFDPAREHPGL